MKPTKTRIFDAVCISLLMIMFNMVIIWMVISWIESPSEQPVAYSDWIQELQENNEEMTSHAESNRTGRR